MIGRLVAPPALPVFIGPGPAHRAEHVAAENPRTEVFEAFLGHGIVDAGLACARGAVHGIEKPGCEKPPHDVGEADAERILQALIWPGTEAVERYAERRDTHLAHVH